MSDAVPPVKPEATQLARQLDACGSRIELARKAAHRHGIFALLGVSPASILPMVGLGIDFGRIGLLGATLVVGGLETWRWVRARAELRDAKAERTRILERTRAGEPWTQDDAAGSDQVGEDPGRRVGPEPPIRSS